MLIKSYPCHGWVIDRTQLRRGEVINDRVMSGNYFQIQNGQVRLDDESFGTYLWFMAQGHNQHENLDTGLVTDQHRGWSNISSPQADGDYHLSVLEDCVVWCFNNTANPTLPGMVTPVRLLSGESRSVNAGDKVFVFDGSFTFDGKSVSGPRQVVFSQSGSITATADTFMIFVG